MSRSTLRQMVLDAGGYYSRERGLEKQQNPAWLRTQLELLEQAKPEPAQPRVRSIDCTPSVGTWGGVNRWAEWRAISKEAERAARFFRTHPRASLVKCADGTFHLDHRSGSDRVRMAYTPFDGSTSSTWTVEFEPANTNPKD